MPGRDEKRAGDKYKARGPMGSEAVVSGLCLVLMGLVPRVSGKSAGIWRSDIPERKRGKRKNSEVESNSAVLA
jgi:hypothetical protein